jgi:hypothetical protein
MNKLSSTKVAEVLAQVPIALRAQQEKIVELEEKLASYEKRDRVTKLASKMEEKNLNPETTFEEKVAALMESDDLNTFEKAIELSARQVKLAALSDHPGNPSNAEDAFVSALMD